MNASAHLEIVIEPGECWGRLLCEDSGAGACCLCVELCPEVFEKPFANRCARVRANSKFWKYADQIEEAVVQCPVNGIKVVRPTVG